MSEIRISNISNRAGTSGPVIAGVTTSIGTGYAKLASGDNSERVGIESGSIRYNETAKLLEFYDGTSWNFIIPAEESANAIGVFGGGATPTIVNTIDYITIATTGNATDFGDLTQARDYLAACSSSTRGVFAGGYDGNFYNIIEYITISTTGNATDFGDLTTQNHLMSPCSSSTRGIFAGGDRGIGSPSIINTIDYITIATTGNATNFGGILSQQKYSPGGCSSSTRGVFGGGYAVSGITNVIDYITIASQGTNATDFGDLTVARYGLSACSSSTRGVFGGGNVDTIDYITIATTGNATNFGDLPFVRAYLAACSSSTRGVFGGGYTNIIEYITIATIGNAFDFGDLTVSRGALAACSNNHGGLL